MTDLNVALSPDLKNELTTAGTGATAGSVNAYAVYFDTVGTNTVANWTTLVNNGTLISNGTADIPLPGTYVGGKVYFLIQSAGTGVPTDIPTLITSQSMINWMTATAFDFGYDSFEVTLQNSSSDVGNLTSVNSFGLPMEVSIDYTNFVNGGTVNSTATVGYNVPGSTVVNDITNINVANTFAYDYTSGPLTGQFRIAASPAGSVSTPANPSPVPNPPFQASDWDGYVMSLEGTVANDITLSGVFNGATDAATTAFPDGVYHNGGYFAYQLQWDSTDDDFWLVPLPSSQIQGAIQISPSDLENSIYATNGTADIFPAVTNNPTATPYLSMNVGANNQWGKILLELFTGFTGGFFGEDGNPANINPQLSGSIDLDKSMNWDPSYAFEQNVSNTQTAYQSYDKYSQIFFTESNSYGSGYSDALMQQYAVGGPQISVSEKPTSGTAFVNVPSIDLTIFANGETPTGYQKPEIYNNITAGPTGYALPNDFMSGANVVLNFAVAPPNTQGVVPASTDTITLNIGTLENAGTQAFGTVTFDGSTAGTAGLWQIWDITDTAGTIAASPAGSPQTVGSMLLELPVANPGTGTTATSWYQIGVGGKTFNLYTTTTITTDSTVQFVDTPGSLAIDGLAQITPPQNEATSSTFSVAFAVGAGVSVDPSLFVLNSGTVGAQPYAPVAGTLASSGTTTTYTALAGQDNPNTNTITTADPFLAFAWTGDNIAAATSLWVDQYTNKIDALTVARVMVKSGGTLVASTTGTADIDGQWQTGTVAINPGTYTITVQEFAASGTAFMTPLSPKSQPLVLTETGNPCFVTGTQIRTAHGGMPVESITVGEQVRTVLHDRLATVIWAGQRQVNCARHPDPRQVWPVRVQAGAFGEGQPHRDLFVSPDHAIYVNDVLIPVKHLINGSTITQTPRNHVTYHHLELAEHDVLLAEGLPVESYLNTNDSTNYANRPEPVRLHPDFSTRTWEAFGCARLVVTGPELNTVRQMLQDIAAAERLLSPSRSALSSDKTPRSASRVRRSAAPQSRPPR